MDNLKDSIFTETYFIKILQNYLNLKVKIKNLKIEPCNGTGEGFLSSLLRIKIEYQKSTSKTPEKLSLIIKSECTNEIALEKIGNDGFDVQNKEINFFQELVPQMMKVFISNMPKIFPQIIKIDEENKILIFEDLQQSNHRLTDRINGMDEIHAALCLKKFAQFHAGSVKVKELNPEAFKNYQTGMFGKNVNGFDEAIISLYKVAIDEISTWIGYEFYSKCMINIKEKILDKLKNCFDVNEDEINVLNHGDLWTTNLMFQYDENFDIPKNLVLIDFQFCHFGSPALDLLRYLFTSINDDLYNADDLKRLLEIYYNELKHYLTIFDCKNIKLQTFDQFIAITYSKLFFGFLFNICVFPIMTSDDPDNDFIAHHTDDERSRAFKKRIMKSERYQRIVKRMLPYYESMGIFK